MKITNKKTKIVIYIVLLILALAAGAYLIIKNRASADSFVTSCYPNRSACGKLVGTVKKDGVAQSNASTILYETSSTKVYTPTNSSGNFEVWVKPGISYKIDIKLKSSTKAQTFYTSKVIKGGTTTQTFTTAGSGSLSPTPTPGGQNGTISGEIVMKTSNGLTMLPPGRGVIEYATSNRGPWFPLANVSNGKYTGSLSTSWTTSLLLRARDMADPTCTFSDEGSTVSTDLIPVTIKAGANTTKNLVLNCKEGRIGEQSRIVIKANNAGKPLLSGRINLKDARANVIASKDNADAQGNYVFYVDTNVATYTITHGFTCTDNTPIPKGLIPASATVNINLGYPSVYYKTLGLSCPVGSR